MSIYVTTTLTTYTVFLHSQIEELKGKNHLVILIQPVT